MKKPVLVIMAAGMGSRYGGLKQIDPVDDQGHIIMDFSIYDAKLAGFEKVVFIIKEENEKDFREAIGSRVEQYMETAYAFQRIQDIPEGFAVPEGRAKPWGTAHAVLSAVHEIDGPFAVINADDYYGRDAFQKIYGYLSAHEDDVKYRYTMVGYELRNTVTDNGHVARGICEINDAGELTAVTERTRIEKREGGIAYTEDAALHAGAVFEEREGLSELETELLLIDTVTPGKSAQMRVFSPQCRQRTGGTGPGIRSSPFLRGQVVWRYI